MESGEFGLWMGAVCVLFPDWMRTTACVDGRQMARPCSPSLRGSATRLGTFTGKMELVKSFGEGLAAGAWSVAGTYRSGDGGAYVYLYTQTLSQVYVVRGMK